MFDPDQELWGGVRFRDEPDPLNVYLLDRNALPMIAEYRRNGVLLDTDWLRRMDEEVSAELERIERRLREITGADFNPASGPQVRRLLFDQLRLPRQRQTASGEDSTDNEALKALAGQHEAVGLLLEWRAASKLLGTYIRALPQMAGPDGRVRTRYLYTSTETGRLSSEKPNLQNIPARTKLGLRVRGAFTAGDGMLLVGCDLSQIEVVWAAHLSADERLLEAIARGEDIHTLTALAAFGVGEPERSRILELSRKSKAEEAGEKVEWTDEERKRWKAFKQEKRLPAKTVTFGILYGQTATGAQANIRAQGGPELSEQQCQRLIDRFFDAYPGIAEWMELQKRRALETGKVWDAFGRVRRVTGALSTLKRIRAKALREAGNMPIQSSAQGMIKLCMAESMEMVNRLRQAGLRVLPLLQIHDELIFEVDEREAGEFGQLLREIFRNCCRLRVAHDASCSLGKRWNELK